MSYEVLSIIVAVNAVMTFGLVCGLWQMGVTKANRPARLSRKAAKLLLGLPQRARPTREARRIRNRPQSLTHASMIAGRSVAHDLLPFFCAGDSSFVPLKCRAANAGGNGGPTRMRTNAGLSLNGGQCRLGGAGTGGFFPVPAWLGIIHRPPSPSGFFRQTPA
jgi:hypothetical protein